MKFIENSQDFISPKKCTERLLEVSKEMDPSPTEVYKEIRDVLADYYDEDEDFFYYFQIDLGLYFRVPATSLALFSTKVDFQDYQEEIQELNRWTQNESAFEHFGKKAYEYIKKDHIWYKLTIPHNTEAKKQLLEVLQSRYKVNFHNIGWEDSAIFQFQINRY